VLSHAPGFKPKSKGDLENPSPKSQAVVLLHMLPFSSEYTPYLGTQALDPQRHTANMPYHARSTPLFVVPGIQATDLPIYE
jgi:hypothetical protein